MLTLALVGTFKTLDAITPDDRPLVGGKAYNCARLKQAGFPVPDGLVVPADAAEDEIEGIAASTWLESLPPGTLFAVRSSGVAEDGDGDSFAGIHETLLNVDRAGLVAAVRRCRQSAQSEQARAYRAARQVSEEGALIAVFVQCMVPAARSGVAFTVNPVTGADELVINAIDGLGEALVSGLVNPDEQILTKTDTSDLGALLVRVEHFYGAPQDIEWCYDGRQYWIVQSRPITTRHAAAPAAAEPAAPSEDEVEWTRANLAEIFPDQPSPQAIDFYHHLLNVAQRAFFGNLLSPESELGEVMKVFRGRPYFNLAQFRYSTSLVGLSYADTLRSLGHAERIHPEDEIKPKPTFGRLARVLPDIVRLAMYDIRRKHVFLEHEKRTARAVARLTAEDPGTLPDRDIWAGIEAWIEEAPESLVPVFVMSSVQFREQTIRAACQKVGVTYEDLAYSHLAAGERSVSSQQAFDVLALSAIARRDPQTTNYLLQNDGAFTDFRAALAATTFLQAFDQFLARYGHRGRHESDWAIPRMHENPAPVLFAIREQLSAPGQSAASAYARQTLEATAAWRRFEGRLTWWQKLTLRPRVKATLRQLKEQYVWREQVRSDLTKVVSALRVWHLTLAKRFVQRGWIDHRDDYFLLLLSEVRQVCFDPESGAGLRDIAERRAADQTAERDLQMPFFMRESELPSMLRAASTAAADGGDLTGLCVSPGAVEADVVVLRDPTEFATMKRGAILVAPATDPSWTPLFTLASGVIVEVGGMLSHASTIAREYGIPALANVKHVTRTLKTGDRVRLDATGGLIVRL
jgi:rifampicin phosphotransferase